MSITLTNGEVLTALQTLRQAALLQLDCPVKGALRIRAVTRQLQAQADIVSEVQRDLLKKHAAKDEDGDIIEDLQTREVKWPTYKDRQKYERAIEELMKDTFEQSHGIRLSDLGVKDSNSEKEKIKPFVVVGLGPLLELPEEESK